MQGDCRAPPRLLGYRGLEAERRRAGPTNPGRGERRRSRYRRAWLPFERTKKCVAESGAPSMLFYCPPPAFKEKMIAETRSDQRRRMQQRRDWPVQLPPVSRRTAPASSPVRASADTPRPLLSPARSAISPRAPATTITQANTDIAVPFIHDPSIVQRRSPALEVERMSGAEGGWNATLGS